MLHELYRFTSVGPVVFYPPHCRLRKVRLQLRSRVEPLHVSVSVHIAKLSAVARQNPSVTLAHALMMCVQYVDLHRHACTCYMHRPYAPENCCAICWFRLRRSAYPSAYGHTSTHYRTYCLTLEAHAHFCGFTYAVRGMLTTR